MGLTVRCDNLASYADLPTDICSISAAKWQVTGCMCAVLVAVGVYMLRKWKYRCHKTLLTFHNLRAAVTLLLLAINSLELARALLPWPAAIVANAASNNGVGSAVGSGYGGSRSNFFVPVRSTQQQQQHNGPQQLDSDQRVLLIGAATLWNALTAILFTIMLMWYHRVAELKKRVAFLYVSATVEILIFLLRVYSLSEIAYYEDIWQLEPCLETLTAVCLLSLGTIDGFSIYKERYKLDYLEDYEKIGYKHTLATFYSKACFWWLNPLLWFGYKEPLELEDLGQMRIEDSARAHYDRFLLIYKTAKVKNADRPPSLWLCYVKSSWRMFTLGGVLKLFGDLFALIGPLAIQQIVQYIEAMYVLHYAALPQMNNSNISSSSSYNNLGSGNNNTSTTMWELKNPYDNTGQANSSGNDRITIRATGSIWLPSLNDNASTNSNDNYHNYNGNNNYNNDNNQNQITNGAYYNDADVQIYYPTWLDLVSNGWAIAWIVLLAALAQGTLSQASTHILNMTGIWIKTSLQGLIYRKTLLLNSSCIDSQRDEVKGDNEQSSNGNDCQKVNSSSTSSSNNNHHDSSNESNLSDVGAITNLMSEDTLNIMSFFWIAHYVWAIPLKIAVVMYLLYLKLGISAIIGSFVCILTTTPLQFLIGKAMSANGETMAKFTDERLKKIHDTFVGIKLIKLNAWDDVFLKKICAARERELKYLNKDSIYWTLMTILTHISSVLITFVTLTVYVSLEGQGEDAADTEFTASHLFSALALFQQLTVPLLIFPITVPIIISAVVSTRRLEKFLQAREIQKQFEGIRHMARILSKSDASLDMYEIKDRTTLQSNRAEQELNRSEAKQEKANYERLALSINVPAQTAPLAQSEPLTPEANCNCADDTQFPFPQFSEKDSHMREKKMSLRRKELLRNSSYVVIRPRRLQCTTGSTADAVRKVDSIRRDYLLLTMPEDVAVCIRKGCFAWNVQTLEKMLTIMDMTIPKERLTIIVGKNGSGKTSLLSAMLMEMPLISGDIIWNKTCTIAFVPQQAWLLNASIRENILFGESFRPKRYDFVLEACALKPDIELMPDADFTTIGERGINLSGGQRQRVAIARALYSSANVVILDDPLSSLDNEVARHIFQQSIKKMLLKANRTVILVTQQLNLVQQADYLIVMREGRLQASGSYKDIAVKYPHIIAKWNAIIVKATEREQQCNDSNAALGRIARERWKLFKNVTKLGLQRSASALAAVTASAMMSADGDDMDVADAEIAAMTAENDDVLPASLTSTNSLGGGTHSLGSFKLTRKRSSLYGSRHLMYDAPLPIDECHTEDVIMRRRRRGTTQRRPSSRASSRLSGISTTSTEMRRSLLTASCSSATSYASNNSSNAGHHTDASEVATRQQRVHSWQPQSAAASKLQHQPVTRNTSSPGSFQQQQQQQLHQQQNEHHQHQSESPLTTSDGALVADLVNSAKLDGGFQQFLRRMSMRRLNKPSTVAVHRMHHRPASATNSILSISEETSAAASSLPSIELSSVATETDTESWITSIENEESVPDANLDYKLLTNSGNVTQAAGKMSATGAVVATAPAVLATASATAATATATAIAAAAAASSPAATTNRTTPDAERKYGKIPTQIYLLYLRASGWPIVLIFFTTALIWQCLRVYTDVWLQHWTDDNNNAADTAPAAAAASAARNLMGRSGTAASGPGDVAAFAFLSSASVQHEVTYYFGVYAVISCVCIVMVMISTPAGQLAGCTARRNLHEKLLRTIMRKSLHFFQVTPLGRIMNRFSNDMAIIDKKIAATSQRLLQFTLLCLCAVLINVSITPWFILLTLPICAAYYAIQKFYRCSSRELQRIENSTNSPIISHLSETIQGVTTIRAYNQEARFTEMLFRRLEANTIAFTILNTSNRWLGISLDYLGGVIVFVAIVTALLAATISCNQHTNAVTAALAAAAAALSAGYDDNNNNNHNYSHRNNIIEYKNNLTAGQEQQQAPQQSHILLSPTPSLVGLAINYTLLMPIYLNWVVKLLADMEMYVGSVERIAYYAEAESKRKLPEIINNDNDATVDDENDAKAAATVGDDADDGDAARAAAADDDDDDVGKVDKGGAAVRDKLTAVTADAAKLNVAQSRAAAAAAATTKYAKAATAAKVTPLLMERNDAERRASLRRIEPHGKRYRPVPISWPQRGDISFENVSLRYEGQSEDVIKNLTLKIPAGQRLGICGRTGSGKSSLALSLFGVLQTTSGRIRIDDVDITQIHPDEIRTRLSIIPQDVHLFNATIRENLDPPGYYSDLALWNCLELAQLKEFVNVRLPQGLDTEIVDGGCHLSAGHRQLLCLARAILRGSVCLLLDEATSSLDSTTETALLEAAHKAFHGRTILTIAHRLTTIVDYDRIIVLENGRIIEDGSPLQLQQHTEGAFHALLHSGRPLQEWLPAKRI